MALENDPSAKMQLKSLGMLMHPGSCCSCGNGNSDEAFVDLGVFFDYEGHMYLCTPCATQVGETLGMYTREEHLTLVAKHDTVLSRIEELTEENDELHKRLDAYVYISGPLGTNSSAVDPVGVESPEQPETTVEPADVPDAGESEVKEPASVSGRKNTSGTKSGDRKFQ